MPTLPFLVQDMSGGFNSQAGPYLIAQNQARDVLNVQGTPAGSIIKRPGLRGFGNITDTLTGMFAMEAIAPAKMIVVGLTSLYQVDLTGHFTAIKTGLTSGRRWEFVEAPVVGGQGPLFGMNGVDTPQQWNGVAASTTAWTNASGGVGVPNGKYCVVSQNQVFVAGVSTNPSRLYWSAIGDPTNWDPASLTGAGFEDFDPNDGQAISAIGLVGPYVLVAKPRKLWILIDPATAQVRRLSNNVGVVAHRSLASGPEGTYFLAEDRGVYRTDGSKLEPLSDTIQPTIDLIQPGLRSQAAGVYWDAHYYLSVPVSSSANDLTLDFDARLQSWWKHSFGAPHWMIWHVAGEPQLWCPPSTGAGDISQAFTHGLATDNGLPMSWRWVGPWLSPSFYRRRWFPTTFYRKRLRQVRLDGTGAVDFSLAKNFAATETLIHSDVLGATSSGTFAGAGAYGGAGVFGGSSQNTLSKQFMCGQVARAFSLVFSATSSTVDELTSYTLMITDRKDNVT